ncbi:MAG: LptF/LptG family permease [Planctomycetes bacterium]|nr:LptF/LptG family permease [Planctomycetota bacterium]
MWRLHRYYLRELAINAGITFIVLFAIVVVALVGRGIQRSAGGGLLDAAVITLFWALDAFPHLLPISFLLATVMTFARANQDREIVAMRSSGISPVLPMCAAVLLGLMLAILGSVAMHYVLPEVHFRKYRVIAEAVRNVVVNMGLGSGGDRIPIPGTDVLMTFATRTGKAGTGEDIVLSDAWVYWPNGRMLDQRIVSPIFHVERVVIPMPDKESAALRIILQHIRDPMGSLEIDQITPSFPARAFSEQSRRDERDDDMVSSQLLAEVTRGVHQAPVGAIYTIYRRTCFSLLPLLFAPIGFCIGLFTRERGRAMALMFSMVPLLVFYAGDIFGARFVRVTDCALFGWLPAALLVVLGLPFCWRELRR